MNQKIGGGILALLILFFATKAKAAKGGNKSATGTVDIEAPTTYGPGAGVYGGTGFEAGYGIEHTETEMERLIRVSNGFGETTIGDGREGLISDVK